MSYVMGIDTSTTATKAIVVDSSGQVVATGVSEYDYHVPQPGWSEQHPELWWAATREAVATALRAAGLAGRDIAAIGMTGQMHGLVLLDESNAVLRPAILWNDQRTQVECDEMRTRVGRERLVEITGNDALTGFTAPKLLWVRNHEPAVFDRIRHVLLPKDYVRLKLTDSHATDRAGGSGTHLFDLAARTWSPELLDKLELDIGLFPPTFEGPSTTGHVTNEAAAETGLAAGTPVMAGGGDQAANAIGTGAITEGIMSLSLGTSGVIFAAASQPGFDTAGAIHAFCHAAPDTWHLMGVMLSAAGSLRWYRDSFAPDADFESLTSEAAAVDPGAGGVTFLPYLTGERTPHADPNAAGAFVGLNVAHGRPELTRAVLEGVAFGLRDNVDLMNSTGIQRVDQIRASGGGTKSPVWRQIIADVLDTELVTVTTPEGAAFGAATLAAVGTGWFSDVTEACAEWVQFGASISPSGKVPEYEQPYERYRTLYPALRDWQSGR
ncbi:MAG: xylulokinase [Acidimicrobiia bacterium]|nr:xylulokinase [Acidimicrobiia bacterium]